VRWLGVVIAASLVACSRPPVTSAGASGDDARALYERHCAECHGERRYGGYAPPLIPGTLGRKSDEALVAAVLEGLPNTQMPGFSDRLSTAQAQALVALSRSPLGEIVWTEADIRASRLELATEEPAFPPALRRENLILVVERGTGSVSVLDGDSLRELDRFEVGRIHGGPKFDRDLRKVLATTRDGTLIEYDLSRGAPRRKLKVAVNTRNLALSPEGDFVAVANQLPANLVVLDERLEPLRVFPLEGQPSAVYAVPGESRFLLALRDLPRLESFGHPGLERTEVALPEPFEDFTFVPGTRRLLASSRGGRRLWLFDLDAEQVRGVLETEGLPHLFSAAFFERQGVLYAALNHIGVPKLSLLNLETFQVEKTIGLRGSGYFVRTHPGSPYLWVDTNTDEIQLVEKGSLELASEALQPAPGKMAMHVEFTAEGDRALVSVWHPEGAVVVYDSRSLKEVARLPYATPVGKYNAYNKTRLLR
jgi:mono/diheme cytochrome c family protein